MRPWAVRLFAFSLALGGLRHPLLFAVAAAAAWWTVRRERPALGPAAPWLPWLVWAFLSAFACAQPLAALPALARWSAVLACASLAASWGPQEREEWLRSLFIVASGLAIAALATGAGRGWRSEMTGLIPPNYNYTAFVLAAATAAAGAWLLHPRGPRGPAARTAAAACALWLACLWLSRSRGAWLGLGAAAAVWSVRRWGARAAAGASVAAALLGAALAGGMLPRSAQNLLYKNYRPHADARPRIWKAAAAIASDHPLLGVGPGGFAAGFRLRPVPFEDGAARWGMSTAYAHSEPLQAAGETGWAGLALWLLGAGAAMLALFRRAGDDPVREAAAAAAAAMTAQLAVDNMLQIPALAVLWLCAFALAGAPSGRRRWPAAAAYAGAALALVAWIPKTLADASPALAASVFPAEPGPREDLAYAALASGKAADADAHLAAAQRLEPFNAVHPWRRAQIAGAAGDWAGAERLAAGAIELEPAFLGGRLARAEALTRLGRASEARALLDEVQRLRSARPDVPRGSGYERTIWRFDPAEFNRVAALAGGPRPR